MDIPAPYASGHLERDGQRLYWEEVGDPAGPPAVWLHGGPGGSSTPGTRRLFVPGGWRAVLTDQRGCGRSTPSAADPATSLEGNTTDALIADLEAVRVSRGIERWVVVGGSWGSTLALAYALAHPDRVEALVLVAVTTGDPSEIEWITRGVGRIFPEEWARLVGHLAPEERGGNLALAYSRLLESDDAAVRRAATERWMAWEEAHVSLVPGASGEPMFEDPREAYGFARLVTHYWGRDCFLPPGHVLAHASSLRMPVEMIHGRWDVSGPLWAPWRVTQEIPHARLTVVDDAGHGGGGFNAAIRAALGRVRDGARGGT